MKLVISLLLVCVMVYTAQAAPAQAAQDSSMGTGIGENAYAISDVYTNQRGRGSSAVSGARQGVAISQSRSYTIDDTNTPEETEEEQIAANTENTEGNAENVEGNAENVEGNAENAEGNAENAEGNAENVEGKAENAEANKETIVYKAGAAN